MIAINSLNQATCSWSTSVNGILFMWGVVKSWDGVCPKYAIWSWVARCCTLYNNQTKAQRREKGNIHCNWTIQCQTRKIIYWKLSYRVSYFFNINCSFICNVKENIICCYGLSSPLFIPAHSHHLRVGEINGLFCFLKRKFQGRLKPPSITHPNIRSIHSCKWAETYSLSSAILFLWMNSTGFSAHGGSLTESEWKHKKIHQSSLMY